MEYYAGIDIGTSSAKLVLVDREGAVAGQCGQEYRVEQPKPGWKEIDPEVWFEAAKRGLVRLLAGIDPKLVRCIGVTGQMHTTVFMDGEGRSIRPAIMWNDTRTSGMIGGLREALAGSPETSYISGIISTGSPASNLLWLREQEPEHFRSMRKFLIGPDYVVYRLCNVYGTDYCEASTSSLYDLGKREWSSRMMELTGLDPSVFPQVRGSAQVVGWLRDELANELGLSRKTAVIAGTGDNPAAAVSTGCLERMYPVLSLGTSGVLMVPKEKLELGAKGKHILFSIDGEKVFTLVQGVVQSAGGSMNWWVKEILRSDDFDRETGEIDLDASGSREVLFYPHLVGDKTIYGDSSLRGAFVGLGTEVTRANLCEAVMEGISFGVRELAEEMHFTRESLSGLKVTGGGAKSRVWMQILADVLGAGTEQLNGNIGAAYGIALLAGYGCGGIASLEAVMERSVEVKRRFAPRRRHVELYGKKYTNYRKIHDAVKMIYGS